MNSVLFRLAVLAMSLTLVGCSNNNGGSGGGETLFGDSGPNSTSCMQLDIEEDMPWGSNDPAEVKLYEFITTGEVGCVRRVLQEQPDLVNKRIKNTFGHDKGYPVFVALESSSLFFTKSQAGDPAAILRVLFEYGVDTKMTLNGKGIFQIGVELATKDRYDVVPFLIQSDKFSVRDAYLAALDNSKSEWVKLLLAKNFDIDEASLIHRGRSVSVVQYAFLASDMDCSQLVLDQSKNVDQLISASRQGLAEIALLRDWKPLALQLAKSIQNPKVPVVGSPDSKNLLELSVLKQDIDAFNVLLSRGIDPNDNDGQALYIAMFKTNNSTLRNALVDRTRNFRTSVEPGQRKMSYLHAAAQSSDVELIQKLIKKGAGLEAKDANGETPLFYSHQISIAETLLKAGAKVNVSSNGETLVQRWTRDVNQNWLPMADQYGAKFSGVTADNRTLLHEAVVADNLNAVQFLLTKGLDVNARDKMAATPIIDSCSVSVLDTLINAGADINAMSVEERYILGVLASPMTNFERVPMMKRLLAAKPRLNMKTMDGTRSHRVTVLHLAFGHGSPRCGPDRPVDNFAKHRTRLQFGEEHVQVAELLLQAGADPNGKDEIGYSVPDAVYCLNSEQIRLLGKYNANFSKLAISRIEKVIQALELDFDRESQAAKPKPETLEQIKQLIEENKSDLQYILSLRSK